MPSWITALAMASTLLFVHNLSDFEVFAVEMKEKVQEPKQP